MWFTIGKFLVHLKSQNHFFIGVLTDNRLGIYLFERKNGSQSFLGEFYMYNILSAR